MKKKIDFTKPIQTVSGHPVRVLATDIKGTGYPFIVAIEEGPGKELVDSFNETGSHPVKGFCLVNTPQKRYANIYNMGSGECLGGRIFDTLEEAKEVSFGVRTFVKVVEFEL